jgi:hypothetical protein
MDRGRGGVASTHGEKMTLAPSGYRMRRTFFGDISVADYATVQGTINAAQATFPTLQSALSYINQQWDNFTNIGATLIRMQGQASAIAQQADALGRSDIAADMRRRITYLGQLNVMAGNMLDEYDALMSGLANLGLDSNGNPGGAIPDSAFFGQEPVTLVAATALAILVAGTVLYINFHTSEQSQAIASAQSVLAMLSKGQITAPQAQALIKATSDTAAQSTQTGLAGALGSLKGIILPVAVVAGVYLLVPLLEKGRKRG